MIHNFQIEKPYEHMFYVFKELLDTFPAVKGERFMMRYSIPSDPLFVNIRDEQKDTFREKDLDYYTRVHAWLNMSSPMHYTIFHGSKILMLASISPVAEGIAEISFMTDKAFVESPLSVRLTMLRFFKQAVELLPFRRLQSKVKHDFKVGIDFVEYLGFVKEGVLRKFGPLGDDYIIFGKV